VSLWSHRCNGFDEREKAQAAINRNIVPGITGRIMPKMPKAVQASPRASIVNRMALHWVPGAACSVVMATIIDQSHKQSIDLHVLTIGLDRRYGR